MGVWLLPRPPAVRSFHFAFPDDDDLEQIIELCRPMKLSNFVPTPVPRCQRSLSVRLRRREPRIRALEGQALDLATRAAGRLREQHGLGAWNVSGAFYGPSMAALDPMIQRVRDHFGQSGKARYIAHEEAASIPPLQVAINAFSGIPELGELGLLKWRPGGGNLWFLPGTPMDGKIANEFQTHLPRHLRGARHGLHGDECLRAALSRAACM